MWISLLICVAFVLFFPLSLFLSFFFSLSLPTHPGMFGFHSCHATPFHSIPSHPSAHSIPSSFIHLHFPLTPFPLHTFNLMICWLFLPLIRVRPSFHILPFNLNHCVSVCVCACSCVCCMFMVDVWYGCVWCVKTKRGCVLNECGPKFRNPAPFHSPLSSTRLSGKGAHAFGARGGHTAARGGGWGELPLH